MQLTRYQKLREGVPADETLLDTPTRFLWRETTQMRSLFAEELAAAPDDGALADLAEADRARCERVLDRAASRVIVLSEEEHQAMHDALQACWSAWCGAGQIGGQELTSMTRVLDTLTGGGDYLEGR